MDPYTNPFKIHTHLSKRASRPATLTNYLSLPLRPNGATQPALTGWTQPVCPYRHELRPYRGKRDTQTDGGMTALPMSFPSSFPAESMEGWTHSFSSPFMLHGRRLPSRSVVQCVNTRSSEVWRGLRWCSGGVE